MKKTKQLLFSFFFIIVMMGFSSCSSSGGGGDGDSTISGVNISVSQFIEASIGGTITTNDGYSLDIPPGALAQDETITVTPISEDSKSDSILVAAMKFEPDGIVLDKPAKVIMPLPSSWDDGNPAVYESNTNKSGDAVYAEREATLTGAPGAYFAEAEVNHFSILGFAWNCHAGTIKLLMKNLINRGCIKSNDYDKVFEIVKEKYKDIVTKLLDPKRDKKLENRLIPDEVWAFLGTYFYDFGGWDENVPIEEELDQILGFVRKGRQVILTFTSGKWKKRTEIGYEDFYEGLKHTAVLELDNSNKVQIVNALRISSDKADIFDFCKKNDKCDHNKMTSGEVIYMYPAKNINTFRTLHQGDALDEYLCTETGCLDPVLPSERKKSKPPWTAVRVYVEKADKLKVEYKFNFEPPITFPDYIASYLKDYSHAITYSAYNQSNGYALYSIDYSGLCRPDTPRAGFSGGLSASKGVSTILGYLTKKLIEGDVSLLADNIDSTDLSVIDFDNEKMFYSSRGIMSEVDHAPVFFYSNSGIIEYEEWDTRFGYQLKGDFNFELSGNKNMPDGSTNQLSISCNGTFDGLLLNERMGSIDTPIFNGTACPKSFASMVIHNNTPVTLTFTEFEHFPEYEMDEATCRYGQNDIPMLDGTSPQPELFLRYDPDAGACGETGNINNVIIEDEDWFNQWIVKSTVRSIQVAAFKNWFPYYQHNDQGLLDAMTEFVNNAVNAEVGWPCDF